MADNDKVQFENLKNKQTKPVKTKTKSEAPKKVEKKEKDENKDEIKTVENAEKTDEVKTEEKEKKPIAGTTKPKEKKDYAIVNGYSLRISTKQSIGIGRFLKGMKIDDAIKNLELVQKKKLAVPMKGEMPHRKGKKLNGKGMMTGKYPINASKVYVKLLKTLKGNSIVNGLELENTRIVEVISNKAPDRMHRFGSMKFKQTHVMIKAQQMKK